MELFNNQSFLVALFIGLASGSIGAFIILRRMALVGDALSHVALPGIALALSYQIDPFWGVLVFLLAAAFLIWWLEGRSRLSTEAIVGLLFTASLAVGVLTIPDHEIIESLFGEFPLLPATTLFMVLGSASLMAVLSFVLARKLLFVTVSPEVAKVSGVGRKYDLVLFLIFSVVVALGIKLVGTLLMGALTIIPASIAKNVSRSMSGYIINASIIGAFVAVVGVVLSRSIHIIPGPTIILFGAGLFLVSLIFARR
ncbi:MAG: metal ABC transporter permease [bacterium]|nr:metal ABC transporter permease [bacterium]